MLSLWIAAIVVFATLVEAEQASNVTKPIRNIATCEESEHCIKLGGECFSRKSVPEGAELIKEKGKKVRCNDKKWCLCYKLKEAETPSTAVSDVEPSSKTGIAVSDPSGSRLLTGSSGAEVTMSSEDSRYPVANCFDGILNNMCHSRYLPEDVPEQNPWISIKFPQPAWINSVSVINRHDCCDDRFREAVAMVGSISPNADTTILTDGTQLGVKFPGGLGLTETHTFSGDKAVWGNVVTVQLHIVEHLNLAEVLVSYQKAGSYGQIIIAQWLYDSRFTADNVFTDDSPEVNSDPRNYWITPDGLVGDEAFFIMDLKCLKEINSIQMRNTHNGANKDRGMKQVTILASINVSGPWRQILQTVLPDPRNLNPPPLFTCDTVNGAGRYVKVQVDSFYGNGGGLQFFEIGSGTVC